MKRTLGVGLLAAVCVLALALVAGCGSSSSSSGGSGSSGGSATVGATVKISDNAFTPESVDIKVGEAVEWTNFGSNTHTVVGSGGINSGMLGNADTYTKTFDKAGTFKYNCSIHPNMIGEVVVQ